MIFLHKNSFKIESLLLWQSKVNKSKIFLPFSKFMKRSQTKFHADTIIGFKVIRWKIQDLWLGQNFLQHSFFSLHQHLIKTAATDVDMLLHVYLIFWHNIGFFATFVVVILFCHYWAIESTLGAVVLHLKIYQCRTFWMTSGDFLTLNTSHVRLDWFSSAAFCLYLRSVFHTFDFCFTSTAIDLLPIG